MRQKMSGGNEHGRCVSVLILLIFILAASYVCYRFCFFVPKQTEEDLFRLPDTEQYARIGKR